MTVKDHPQTVAPNKRVEVTDSSGWTHVLHGRRNVRKTCKLSSQLDTLRLSDKIPLEQVVKDHARCVDLWKGSECWKNLATLLHRDVLSPQQRRLTSCVCLGLGSLSAGKASSKYEMAALVSILHLLSEVHLIDKVVFQDPAFNDVDEAFLTGLGFLTVQTPLGFESIDQNTFCFAPHLEHDVFAMALRGAHPALCIGNSNILADRPLHSTAVDSEDILEVFRSFINSTKSTMMPEFALDTWCQFTSIYWLRDDGE